MAVRSVDRAIDVLMQFIECPVMSVVEIQRRIDLPRPTLYRMLAALEAKGLVSSWGDPRRYRLGHQVLELASAWKKSFDLSEISDEHLARLHEETDESVILSVPQNDLSRIVVSEFKSTQPLNYSRSTGYSTSLVHGAGGKVILAFLKPADIDRAIAALPSPAEQAQARKDLAWIRSKGYFIAFGEVIPGAASIAAPIFGHEQTVVGSVGLLGPEIRINTPAKTKLIERVVETAAQISRAAGFRGEVL